MQRLYNIRSNSRRFAVTPLVDGFLIEDADGGGTIMGTARDPLCALSEGLAHAFREFPNFEIRVHVGKPLAAVAYLGMGGKVVWRRSADCVLPEPGSVDQEVEWRAFALRGHGEPSLYAA